MFAPFIFSYHKTPDQLWNDYEHSWGEFSFWADVAFEKHLFNILKNKNKKINIREIQYFLPLWYGGVW